MVLTQFTMQVAVWTVNIWCITSREISYPNLDI